MQKITLPVLALLAVGGIGFGFMEHSAAQKAQQDADQARAKLGALENAFKNAQEKDRELSLAMENNARLQTERDAAKRKVKELESSAATGSPGDGSAPALAANSNGGMRGMLQNFAKQMDNPEVRGMMKQGQERMISRSYDRLFKELNLSDDESKLLADIIAERNLSAMDKGRKLLDGSQTDQAAMAVVKKEVEATKAEYDLRMKAVLGDERFHQLSNYEQTIGDRRSLDFASESFNRKNAPLEAGQKDALMNVMREERQETKTDLIPDLGGGPGMTMLMSDTELKSYLAKEQDYQKRVLNRAPSAGLTPDQVIILQDSFNQRNQWRQYGGRMGRGMFMGR